MNTEDVLIFGLMAAVAVLFMRQQQQPAQTTQQATLPAGGVTLPGGLQVTVPAQPTPVCPLGQSWQDIGDIAPVYACAPAPSSVHPLIGCPPGKVPLWVGGQVQCMAQLLPQGVVGGVQ